MLEDISHLKMPPFGERQRIGLLGGTFNPPHDGHRLISEMALKKLRLDWVWWLVTPGNPLKENSTLPTLEKRMAMARPIARHPKIKITGVEASLGTRYTADTLEKLRQRAPRARFIWLMGADNLCQFSRWERWQDIAATIPIAVYDRPGYQLAAFSSKAAHRLRRYELCEKDAMLLARAGTKPPQLSYLRGPLSYISSTALRAAGTAKG